MTELVPIKPYFDQRLEDHREIERKWQEALRRKERATEKYIYYLRKGQLLLFVCGLLGGSLATWAVMR